MTSEVIIMGDFNADPHKRFGIELLAFAHNHGFKVRNVLLHGQNSNCFTNVSEARGTTSWLDHITCTGTAHRNVISCDKLDLISFYDHIPLQLVYGLNTNLSDMPTNTVDQDRSRYVDWDAATVQKQNHTKLTESMLSRLGVNKEVLLVLM